MLRIGITGQQGFIGNFLFQTINLYPEKYQCISFERKFFDQNDLLDKFVEKCDVIIHLAAMNRHSDQKLIFQTNINLTEKLISSLLRTKSKAQIIFSSSTQEFNNSEYGQSKKICREKLSLWASKNQGKFVGLIIPNVFGPFGKPYYNSVIATFCHQLNSGQEPVIQVDAELNLIYINELVNEILHLIDNQINTPEIQISHSATYKVSEILGILKTFKEIYLQNNNIPALTSNFELNLFNTFRSYIELNKIYPIKYIQHIDNRGTFTELIRLQSGGQVSFSTTAPKITRGNHFHTRKIERFSVIKGKALIQLRKIGTKETFEFELNGSSPSFVDMPIWYTHNITNIGEEELYTVFWINEEFNPHDPDTYFEIV